MAAAPRWTFDEALRPLLDCLARGGVLAIPTESSYGLAVDPRQAAGVAAIHAIKGRSDDKGLPVVAADVGQITALGVDPAAPALAWASPHWPAPLTVVLPVPVRLPASPASGPPSLAIRIPSHETLRKLLAGLGGALTATSANPAGQPPLVDPAAVAAWLGPADAIVVDGGTLPGGLPSTLVDLDHGRVRILRHGAFSWDRPMSSEGGSKE